MDNWCALCGEQIPDGQLFCKSCALLVKDLSPEQQRALEKINSEEEAREQLRAAINNVKAQLQQALAPVVDAIVRLSDIVCTAIAERSDEE